MISRYAITAIFLAATFFACEAAPTGVTISNIVVNPPLGGRDVGAIYLTLDNSGDPTVLISVSSPDADVIELHQSTRVDGIARMDRLDTIPLPTGTTKLEQGGLHLMVFGITEAEVADGLPLTLTLEDGTELNVVAN